MKINQIIKQKRNELNLSQKDIADYLGVSSVAISKWENGVCYPDIELLPSLARLLNVDLNTLLSFNEDLSDVEVHEFINQLFPMGKTNNFDETFVKATNKIREYNTSYNLILLVATMLYSNLLNEENERYEYYHQEIIKLFQRCFDCPDILIKEQATSMLFSNYLNKLDYIAAQNLLDKLNTTTVDKEILSANLAFKQEDYQYASQLYESKLLSTITKVQDLILYIINVAIKQKDFNKANFLADISKQSAMLFELYPFLYSSASFEVATQSENIQNTYEIAINMLQVLDQDFDASKSTLYQNIKAKKIVGNDNDFFKAMVIDYLNELSFFKDTVECKTIMNKYNKKNTIN